MQHTGAVEAIVVAAVREKMRPDRHCPSAVMSVLRLTYCAGTYADSPQMVTLSGEPPKAAMFS